MAKSKAAKVAEVPAVAAPAEVPAEAAPVAEKAAKKPKTKATPKPKALKPKKAETKKKVGRWSWDALLNYRCYPNPPFAPWLPCLLLAYSYQAINDGLDPPINPKWPAWDFFVWPLPGHAP